MSQEVADYVRGKAQVVVVSDAYLLAPWADALVSADAAWWEANPDAMGFGGLRFAAVKVPGVRGIEATRPGTNSGLLGCHVAQRLGAKRILLCGFDMRGDHFFGIHQSPLKNTKPERFEGFKAQFAKFDAHGLEIINCTPGSALKRFPAARLEDVLC